MDCALSLIRLGMERQIPGLLLLCDNLVTLETLVYEAGCDMTLTLEELQRMTDSEKLRLLMSSVSVGFVFSHSSCPCPFIDTCPLPGAKCPTSLRTWLNERWFLNLFTELNHVGKL